MKTKRNKNRVSAAGWFYGPSGFGSSLGFNPSPRPGDINISVQGSRTRLVCPSCGRTVDVVDGRPSTHGPGFHGEMVCSGGRQ